MQNQTSISSNKQRSLVPTSQMQRYQAGQVMITSSNNSSIVQISQLPHNPAQFAAPGTYQYQSLTNLGAANERDTLGLDKVLSMQQ